MQDLIGHTLGHYRVVEQIGAGGMGVVYRARDERLDRDVAIKVLPEAVAADSDRLRRFEREAKAVATLSHSNILEIFDFDHEGEVSFSVTELLEGETLQEHLQQEPGPLHWRRVQEIGAAVADGLGAAHGKGVVHRDIKPSNIFLCSDGRVKILDFGLAATHDVVDSEAVTGSFEAPLTREGRVLGTVGYMAPEQVRGEPADHRADVFALGCVLYEMVLGRRAFVRDTAAETMAAILKEEPADISTSGDALPAELAGTVRRCLEKRPESRFQSASDLAYTLRTSSSGSVQPVDQPVPRTGGWRRVAPWAALGVAVVVALVLTAVVRVRLSERGSFAPPELSPNRVAVVPMENRTGDPSLDTLGHLAADLIVQRFTETGAVEVVPLADALQELPSAGPDRDQSRGWALVLERARERGAALVLSGAYYLDGGALQLQARLVDAATGDLIYAFEPVAAARKAAAEGVESLGERVLAGVAAHVNEAKFGIAFMRPPSTYLAFQAFQRGNESFGAFDWPEAVAHYRRALEIDPDFHLARMFLVWAHFNPDDLEGAEHALSGLEERLDRMTRVERAYVRSQRCFLDMDYPAAVRVLRRGLETAPQSELLRLDLAWRAIDLNHPGEAVAALEPILDSYAPGTYRSRQGVPGNMAAALHLLGYYERELEYAELSLEHFPDEPNSYFAKLRALAGMGQPQAVNEIVEEYLASPTQVGGWSDWSGSAGWLMVGAARELRAHGHPKEAHAMAARSVAWYESHPDSLEPFWFVTALWMVGRVHDAEVLVDQQTAAQPGSTVWAGIRGAIAAANGDVDAARQISADLPADDRWARAQRTAWRAVIAAHLGEKERAVAVLAESYSQGNRYDVRLHQTLWFEPLWDYPPFQELIEPKG